MRKVFLALAIGMSSAMSSQAPPHVPFQSKTTSSTQMPLSGNTPAVNGTSLGVGAYYTRIPGVLSAFSSDASFKIRLRAFPKIWLRTSFADVIPIGSDGVGFNKAVLSQGWISPFCATVELDSIIFFKRNQKGSKKKDKSKGAATQAAVFDHYAWASIKYKMMDLMLHNSEMQQRAHGGHAEIGYLIKLLADIRLFGANFEGSISLRTNVFCGYTDNLQSFLPNTWPVQAGVSCQLNISMSQFLNFQLFVAQHFDPALSKPVVGVSFSGGLAN